MGALLAILLLAFSVVGSQGHGLADHDAHTEECSLCVLAHAVEPSPAAEVAARPADAEAVTPHETTRAAVAALPTRRARGPPVA